MIDYRPVRLKTLTVGLLTMSALLVPNVCARAQQPPDPDGTGTDFFVTIAARMCDSYTDITANKSRNNIQESLRDLGPDTKYKEGDLVNPASELDMQPKCRPLTGWRFTLGTAIAPQVTGPWGALSVVSGPFPTDITTLDSIPDRDSQGRQTSASPPIEGATTIELSQGELDQSPSGNLWLQGGTPDDPVLDQPHPNEYGFGALRCATDNVNGDNVEYIQFPAGVRHVYCFAYYVVPPPTSGTIVIQKHVSTPANATQPFTFEGNISYTPDNTFTLDVNNGQDASMTFYRAATGPTNVAWRAAERVPAGWRLTGRECVTTKGSAWAPEPANGVSIRLVAGDTVTCTFTDEQIPPQGHLLITKRTVGGIGTFPITVSDSGGKPVLTTEATTTAPGEPATAKNTPVALDAGRYRVSETLPRATGGRWRAIAAYCNAQRERTRHLRTRRGGQRAREAQVEVEIAHNEGQVCRFENRFVPYGSIAILKATLGDTGSTGFIVTPVGHPAQQYLKTATTTAPGQPVRARGDSTRHLALGRYLIQETATVSNPLRDWQLLSVSCDGQLHPFTQGQVVVDLTRDDPDRVCGFVNGFAATPVPPIPPIPPLPPNPSNPAPKPELVIKKRALRPSVRLGRSAVYLITVRNTGTGAAHDVVVADRPGKNSQLVSAHPSQGTCDERTPITACKLGTIEAGKGATIRVRVRATGTPRMDNVAVVGSGALELALKNNVARASVRVRRAPGVVGCASAAGPLAHAAC